MGRVARNLRRAVVIGLGGACLAGLSTGLAAAARPAQSGWQLAAKVAGSPARMVVLESVVAVGADDAWAAGITAPRKAAFGAVIERWSGRGWHRVQVPDRDLTPFDEGPPEARELLSLVIGASSARNVWAFNQLTGAWLHWDGRSWSHGQLPRPAGSVQAVITAELVSSAADAWAVGGAVRHDGSTRSYAAHFNGHRWLLALPPAKAGLPVSGVSEVGPDDVWITIGYAGQLFFPAQGNGGSLARWNGHGWQARPLPKDFTRYGDPVGVLALSDHQVWVVGGKATSDGGLTSAAARWSGSSWQSAALPGGAASGDCVLRRAAPAGSGLLAVSDCFNEDTGAVVSGLWRLSGGHWSGPSRPRLAGGTPAFVDVSGKAGRWWAVGDLGHAGIIASCRSARC